MSTESISFVVKEVYFPSGDASQCVCIVAVGEEVFKLEPPFQSAAKTTAGSVTASTKVQVELFYEDHLQAAMDFPLSEFFPAGLTGSTENWVLLNDSSDDSSDLYTQVKLWMGFSSNLYAKTCPYLSALEAVMREEAESARRFAAARTVAGDAGKREEKAYFRLQSTSAGDADLEVELPRLASQSLVSLSAEQQDHLKSVLFALEARFAAVKASEEELQRLRVENRKLEQGRKNLESAMTDTTKQLREEGREVAELLEKLERERNELAQNCLCQDEKISSMEAEIEELKAAIAVKERNSAADALEQSEYVRAATHCEDLRKSLEGTESALQKSLADFRESISEFQQRCSEFSQKEAVWTTEKAELSRKLQDSTAKVEQLQCATAADKAEIAALKAQLRLMEGLKLEAEAVKMKARQTEEREKTLREKLKATIVELDAHKDDYDNRISQMLSDRKRMSEVLSQKDVLLECKQSELSEQVRLSLDLQNRITTLEQLCCGKEDLHILLERISKECEVQQESKNLLSRELNRLLEFLVGVSQKKMEIQRNAMTMKQLIAEKDAEIAEIRLEKDAEIDSLRQQIAKLKKKGPPYVPVKDDAVDAALADFLNSRDEPLLVPFKREQPEIYSFGTKRTHMKLENCRLAVRVGGGYKLLDEFIEEYTPVELAKREKMFHRTASVEDRKLARSATELQTGDDPKRKTASPTKGRK